MKKLILASAAAIILASCGNNGNEPNPVVDSLNTVNGQLSKDINKKDSAIVSFLRAFNEIQENLDQIKEKQKIITQTAGDAESQKTPKDQIVADIQAMNELMDKNKKALSAVSAKLKKANVKIADLEKTIAMLTKQIEEKDGEISALKEQLEKANVAYKELFAEYNTKLDEIDNQTKKINTAYYAFGTTKELVEKGVMTKEGGFIGIGKSAKLKNDFNKDYFTKVDITETTTIPIGNKKAKLITTHPASSYKLEGTKDKVEKLVISNPEEFWGASKYLVIVVE